MVWKQAASLFLLLMCVSSGWAQGPKQAPKRIIDPESETRDAITFLETLDWQTRIYIRLGSIYSIAEEDRPEFNILWKVGVRQLTLRSNRQIFFNRVPDSPTLFWCDIRSFGWNDAAWRAVAQRDKAFREGYTVSPPIAQRMRKLIGENQPTNFHIIGIVDLFGLFRRTYQTTQSPDYYDLLFAEQRYPCVPDKFEKRAVLQFWKGGIWTDGKNYPPGLYSYFVQFPVRKFVDFPQNQKEWTQVFLGGIKERDFNEALVQLRSRRGAVVNGMEDVVAGEPRSFVARNNRLFWMNPLFSSFGAAYGETFDVNKTAGKRDLLENAFTDQGRDRGRVFRDGGELIVSLPAGDGIATLVINGAGKRIESVPPEIAIHSRDSRDRTVRNGPMACFACHGDAYGWIPWQNIVELFQPGEIDTKFRDLKTGRKDKQAAEDYETFFLNWSDEIKPIREKVKKMWAEVTGTEAQKYEDAWSGTEIAIKSLDWKHKYDDPVDLAQMSRETGAPEIFIRVAASQSVKIRALNAARRMTVPRAAWDEDIFPEIMLLLNVKKDVLIEPRK